MHYPISISPFVGSQKESEFINLDEEEEDEGPEELEDEDGAPIVARDDFVLHVKTANEVPWIDLVSCSIHFSPITIE